MIRASHPEYSAKIIDNPLFLAVIFEK